MKEIFAIGVGGTGAKCVEALIHIHACGLLADADGTQARLGVFLVEPDQQSALLARAQTAAKRYAAMQKACKRGTEAFARAEIKDYGHWSPLGTASSSISLDQIFPKAVLQTQAKGLAALFDCLFPPEEQTVKLEVGFRGRPPIGSAVMSRVSLEKEAQVGHWQEMLTDIETAAGRGDSATIHLFGSVFGGTGASGVPTLGQLLKNWLKGKGLSTVKVQASILLPYFDFDGAADESTGVHAEARNFQLNTDAALQYLSSSGEVCFDRVFLVGNNVKARYGFSIGGVSQSNSAHLIELLAALGTRHQDTNTGYAHVLSRAQPLVVGWDDIPDDEIVGEALSRGARFAVAWRNNFSRELDDAQTVSMARFLSGAPWARHFYNPSRDNTQSTGKPDIRDKEQLTVKSSIDQYCDALLQWLNQVSTNLGSNFKQEMFSASHLEVKEGWVNDLERVVQGKARPQSQEDGDTVESIKVALDELSPDEIQNAGSAGLADSLWRLIV